MALVRIGGTRLQKELGGSSSGDFSVVAGERAAAHGAPVRVTAGAWSSRSATGGAFELLLGLLDRRTYCIAGFVEDLTRIS
jgi:hypothetical protein